MNHWIERMLAMVLMGGWWSAALANPGLAPSSQTYTAPHQAFTLQLPAGWQAKEQAQQPEFIKIILSDAPGSAWLDIRHRTVVQGALSRQLLLQAVDKRFSKLPHFQESSRRRVDLHGVPGDVISGTFWYQGNAQYPRTLEALYAVSGTDAYEFYFECFSPMALQLAPQLEYMYRSFLIPSAQTPQASDPEHDNGSFFDQIPF